MPDPITYRVGTGPAVPRRRRFPLFIPMLAAAALVTIAMVVLAAL